MGYITIKFSVIFSLISVNKVNFSNSEILFFLSNTSSSSDYPEECHKPVGLRVYILWIMFYCYTKHTFSIIIFHYLSIKVQQISYLLLLKWYIHILWKEGEQSFSRKQGHIKMSSIYYRRCLRQLYSKHSSRHRMSLANNKGRGLWIIRFHVFIHMVQDAWHDIYHERWIGMGVPVSWHLHTPT